MRCIDLTRLASSHPHTSDLVPEKNSQKIVLPLVQLSRSVFVSGYIIFIEVMALWRSSFSKRERYAGINGISQAVSQKKKSQREKYAKTELLKPLTLELIPIFLVIREKLFLLAKFECWKLL